MAVIDLGGGKMTMDGETSLADRIKIEREALGMSQHQLAKAAGISRVMVGHYERGDHKPGLHVLEALCKLGGDPRFLLTGSREKPLPIEPGPIATLIHAYNMADKASQDVIVQLARLLTTAREDTVAATTPVYIKALLTNANLRLVKSGGQLSTIEQALVDACRRADKRQQFTIYLTLDCADARPDDAEIGPNGLEKKMQRLIDNYRQADDRTQHLTRIAAGIDDIADQNTNAA